jgi:hypothetical protein
LRFLEAAAFFPAATRVGDFRAVLLRAVVRFLEVDAFLRAGAVLRFRAAAAFRPAATRLGDFRAVLLRAVARFLEVDAFLRAGAVLRFREAAAFFPAATRFGDFRAVLLRPAGLVDAVFLAAVRFRVAAFVLAAVAALRAAVDLRVRVVAGSVAAPSIGPPDGMAVLSDDGVGRSQAGVAGCQDGSGALGAPSALSSRSLVCSRLSDVDPSVSFHRGRSWEPSPIVRSSDDGMTNLLCSRASMASTPTPSKRCMTTERRHRVGTRSSHRRPG